MGWDRPESRFSGCVAGCSMVVLSKTCALSALLLIEDICGSAWREM